MFFSDLGKVCACKSYKEFCFYCFSCLSNSGTNGFYLHVRDERFCMDSVATDLFQDSCHKDSH